MKYALTLALLLLLVSSGVWASSSVVPAPHSTDARDATESTTGTPIPPPAPDDPLIFRIQPAEAQQGQQVLIEGFNFGGAPQVTFNGTVASIVGRRVDNATLVVVVPSGASSGPLVVTNTDTAEASNSAGFIVAPGTFVPACSIVGTVADNTMAALAGVTVAVTDPATGSWTGMDLSDASGDYSIGLATSGEYRIRFKPPVGTSFIPAAGVVNCPGSLNHQFVIGSEVSGRLVESQIPNDPVPNALVYLFPWTGGGTMRTASDSNGEFSFHALNGTYDFFIIGPPGGRQISDYTEALVVSGATLLGDVPLGSGWLLSGTVQYKDEAGTGPWGGGMELTASDGEFAGYSYAIVDGRFWLAGQPGTGHRLVMGGTGAVNLEVQSVDLTSDTGMDHPLTVYSQDAHIPTLPTIIDPDFLSLQESQPNGFVGQNFDGSTVSVRFPDGVGGWVDGDDTYIDPVRGLIVTKTPALAVSGNVHVRVDGVDGPGYPLTIDPGVYDPGSHTVSGTVTDGSDPVEGVLVALLHIECDEETLSDYDVTDASGTYSVNHATGDYFLALLPHVPSGFPLTLVPLSNLTGNTISDVVLEAGDSLSGRIVDSGIGPVGATSAPIRNCFIEAGGDATDAWEWVRTDASGLLSMHLVTGSYEVFIDGPQQSRYMTNYVTSGIPADLGDIPLDSGYFIEGYIVNDAGVGLPGVSVAARDVGSWERMGSAMTVGDTGWFRLAVPIGVYQIEFWMHDDLDYYLPIFEDVNVWTDTLLYPDFEAVAAGHIQGTVHLSDGETPVSDVGISASDFTSGGWKGWADSCNDGTYDIRVGPGEYSLHAHPNDPCLAFEHYDNSPNACDVAPVDVVSGSSTTGIDFTLDPGGSISGRVEDDSGSGILDVYVCVDDGPTASCSFNCAWTDADGSYTFQHIPVAADPRVRASSWTFPEQCWDGHFECTGYDPVAVNECLTTSGIDFNLSDAPGPVPDSHYISGSPMMTTYDQLTNNLTLTWQPTCNAEGHVLYYGNLGQYGVYTQAVCNIGMTGSITVSAPSYDVFFLIAGHTWGNEGSYGVGTGWIERPSAGGGFCGYTQQLGHNCLP